MQVVWLKRDLRLRDHAPLHAAIARGPVLLLYVYEPSWFAADTFDPSHLAFVNDSVSLVETHAEGRIASLISVESGHSIGTSLGVLRMFQRLGAVSLTLTHNCNTPWYVQETFGRMLQF